MLDDVSWRNTGSLCRTQWSKHFAEPWENYLIRPKAASTQELYRLVLIKYFSTQFEHSECFLNRNHTSASFLCLNTLNLKFTHEAATRSISQPILPWHAGSNLQLSNLQSTHSPSTAEHEQKVFMPKSIIIFLTECDAQYGSFQWEEKVFSYSNSERFVLTWYLGLAEEPWARQQRSSFFSNLFFFCFVITKWSSRWASELFCRDGRTNNGSAAISAVTPLGQRGTTAAPLEKDTSIAWMEAAELHSLLWWDKKWPLRGTAAGMLIAAL